MRFPHQAQRPRAALPGLRGPDSSSNVVSAASDSEMVYGSAFPRIAWMRSDFAPADL